MSLNELLNQRRVALGIDVPQHVEPLAPVEGEARDAHFMGRCANWAHKALHGRAATLNAMEVGDGKNDYLNKSAFVLLRFALAGHLDSQEVIDVLGEADGGIHYPATAATLNSAVKGAEKHGPLDPPVDADEQAGQGEDFFEQAVRQARATPEAPSGDPFETGAAPAPPAVPVETPEQREERMHLFAVKKELAQLRARDEAKTIFTSEKAERDFREPPYRPNLTAELLVPRLPTRYAVQDILPAGGNALLTAQYKAGKTTCVTELARCWVDRLLFLGRYVIHSQRRVALWNYELSQNQYNEWLAQSGIENTDDISVLHLRGFRLDLRTKKGEDFAAGWLKDHDIGLWVPDPFARAAVGVDENSNSEVGTWLDTLDVIKARAGVEEAVLPVHTGRAEQVQGQERARGATRLDDWADVRWLLTKDDAGDRFFRATGRDVETEEEKLHFDAETHRLTIGGGDRRWVAARRVEDQAVSYVEVNPGSNATTIAAGIGGNKTDVPRALASAVAHHRLRMVPGKATEKLYFPPSIMPAGDPFAG